MIFFAALYDVLPEDYQNGEQHDASKTMQFYSIVFDFALTKPLSDEVLGRLIDELPNEIGTRHLNLFKFQ